MNKKKWIARVLTTAMIFTSWVLPSSYVRAGVNTPTLDASTLASSAHWNNVSEDVVVDGQRLIFPKESTDYTRFITKTAAEADAYFEHVAVMEGIFKFTHLPKGQEFVLAFGLSDIESGLGESGNVEVAFTNENGIKMDIDAYREDGAQVIVSEPKTVGISQQSAAKIRVEIGTKGTIEVYINGKRVCAEKLPVTGEGRVGFLQTGECGVQIENPVVTFYKYTRPENMDIKEDFENEAMDISGLTAKAITFLDYFPRSMSIVDYEDSRVLKLENTSLAYVGTRYAYSNFEFTFDIPYLQTSNICDDNGHIAFARTEKFGISFGGEQIEWDTEGYQNVADMVVFENKKVYSQNWKDTCKAEHTYWQKDKPLSVKVSVVDGVVTAGMKWMNDKQYETVLTYELTGGTPIGYVHLWFPMGANIVIDNLSIVNKDDNPTLIETEYKSGLITAEDAGYIPHERVYAPSESTTVNQGKTFWGVYSWYLLIPGAIIIGLSTIGITMRIKKRKSKEQEVQS